MTRKASLCNSYSTVYENHFNATKRIIRSSLTENLDQHTMLFGKKRKSKGDSHFFSMCNESTMGYEYFWNTERMPGEIPFYSELQENRIQYQPPNRIHINPRFNNSRGDGGSLEIRNFSTSWLGAGGQAGTSIEAQNHSEHGLSMEITPEEYLRLVLPRSTDMWSPPPSPIFQSSASSVEDIFSDLQSVFPNTLKEYTMVGQNGGSELVEKTFDESVDGSFLYVTSDNVENLKGIFHQRGLKFQDIGKTRTPGVLVVLFKTHEYAKRAFTTQHEIGMSMIPPSPTKKYWFKNPSPKFHVIFETTRRLTVKSGKSSSNANVGDFLMMDARAGKGCTVCADQMKGHRMRVIGFIGKFMRIDGVIIEQKSMSERKIVGWISTQCYKTKERFVVRKSKNEIEDYVYRGHMNAVE